MTQNDLALEDDELKHFHKKEFEQVNRYFMEGEGFMDIERYDHAATCFNNAFEVLPKPKAKWASALQILGAKGDACFLLGDFTAGEEAFKLCMSHGGLNNPFIHMRYGQCLFELDEKEKALHEFAMVHLKAGAAIFAEDDKKYLEYFKENIKDIEEKTT